MRGLHITCKVFQMLVCRILKEFLFLPDDVISGQALCMTGTCYQDTYIQNPERGADTLQQLGRETARTISPPHSAALQCWGGSCK